MVSYNSTAVKTWNTKSSLVPFKSRMFPFYLLKTPLTTVCVGAVVNAAVAVGLAPVFGLSSNRLCSGS
jgi:hypothetical protein